MPLYVLRCPHCEHRFERIMKSTDNVNEERCPKCDKVDCQKVLTSFSNYSIQGNNSASVRPKGAGRIGGKN